MVVLSSELVATGLQADSFRCLVLPLALQFSEDRAFSRPSLMLANPGYPPDSVLHICFEGLFMSVSREINLASRPQMFSSF